MKTRYFGLIIVILASFCHWTSSANAQGFAQSDTINFTASNGGEVSLRNFKTLSVGVKDCHTIFFKNSSGTAVVINSVVNNYFTSEFSFKTIPAIPTVILN